MTPRLSPIRSGIIARLMASKTWMPVSKSMVLFSSRPLASAVLAVLLLAMGLVFVSGLVPTSPNRKYFPGHEWLLAIVCFTLAMFIGYCAAKGRKPKRQEEGS